MAELSAEKAPVVQLLLTASFSPSLDFLSIIDLADLYALFREDYPVFRQISRAAPMTADPFQVRVESIQVGALPRLSFTAADPSRHMMFQSDRFSFGWARVSDLSEPSDYPGFDALYALFREYLERVQGWVLARGIEISPQVGEIVYTDAFMVGENGIVAGAPAADIFTIINPEIRFPVTSIDCTWVEPLTGGIGGFVRSTASGPALSPSGSHMMTLETTANFDLSGGWAVVDQGFDVAHRAGLEIFKRVVNPLALAK
ncbi:hypothetical protein U1763_17320 [Sphingomonas sp. LB2R24]